MRTVSGPPLTLEDSVEHRRLIAAVVQQLLRGEMNNTEEVVLDASGFTVVEDPIVTPDSTILMQAKNAAAADLPWSIVANTGQFTITTDPVATTGAEIFRYAVFGG